MELLSLLLPAAGVTAIVLVCWLAGGAGKAVIADTDAARDRLLQDEPDFAATRVLLAGDRRVALLASDSGGDIAAVMAFGDKLVTRRFSHGSVRSVAVRQQPGARPVLTLLTDDPTCRRIDVALATDQAAAPGDPIHFWLSSLQRLIPAPAHLTGARAENT
jgi:hypothetical protein